MAHDDFGVVAYKVLAYAYACLKAGVELSMAKAEEVAGVNPVYFDAVISSLVSSGLVAPVRTERDAMGLPIAWSGALALTMEGARYVDMSHTHLGVSPHAHDGYYHSEFRGNLTTEGRAMVDRVVQSRGLLGNNKQGRL